MKTVFRLWPVGIFVFIWVLNAVHCTGNIPSEVIPEKTYTEKQSEPIQDRALEPTTPSEKKTEVHTEIPVEPNPEPRPEPSTPDASRPEPEPTTEPMPEPVAELFPELTPDTFKPKPGFGSLSGDCGVLDTEWSSKKSFFFRNVIDLGTMKFDSKKLTQGGQKIWIDGNLGGSSVHSEVFSYEVLERCELAKLLKSEGEIVYKNKGGKKTDLLVSIDGHKVGVSVTRAYNYPPSQPYTLAKATSLLSKKLKDIPLSAANADPKDAWSRSMLHILAYNKQHADVVKQAYQGLSASIKASTLLMVTVTEGKDDYIY